MKVIHLYKAYESLSNAYSSEMPRERRKVMRDLMDNVRKTIDREVKKELTKPKLRLVKG